jgi:hypothetical protein
VATAASACEGQARRQGGQKEVGSDDEKKERSCSEQSSTPGAVHFFGGQLDAGGV